MFGSNALPLPPPFAHDRPLRLSAESARPLPTGECRYLLLHPSAQNQQCSCQSFHLNRSAPGNICECGHQACYHVHRENNNEKHTDTLNGVLDKINVVFDKVKRMEETIQNERSNRDSALQRERQMWEREIRILREALAPFYQSEKEMRRRIVDIEDRVDGNYDEHVRLRDRVVAVDDATMSMEKRVEELEDFRFKRRRVGRNNTQDQPLQNGYVSSDPDNFRRVSSSIDGGSVRTPSSRALSPNGTAPAPAPEPEEPRSSGILNLVAEIPRPGHFVNLPQRLSPPQEEPRSSGFLTLDMGERLKERAASEQVAQISVHQASRITPPQDRPSPSNSAKSNQDIPSRATRTPPEILNPRMPIIDVMVLPGNVSPRKRKHHLDHIALDVLADVTVASPLMP
ncbi:hypothetical protein Z517_10794 [Fonsecaea pedrosoi CBS 271.37]|uniref:Unplaced genomic scaffold supercont1.7, whole genome shotgun sequence n=1 Tax=Fonsecaea pedrosoi CBS 271.37 TaxID=1442368 RepID=A0A0D2GUM3_9EURO|nr:uncharacterized protein Z517_10794 [Fonsecaea pedrosoi CBS 271.37]KIW76049.1 hypothetical protein Z517_10794 [Fonsecaea pedrosoi CBS 271.37]